MTALSMLRPRLLGLLAFASLAAAAVPALALERLTLRGDVLVSRDAVTVADLLEDAPAALADTALFRSPALGQAGTIQTKRILEAMDGLGLGPVETGGRLQIAVSRATRLVAAGEIEAALKKALAEKHGFDTASTGISFDGPAPGLMLPPDAKGEIVALDLLVDRRNRRVTGSVGLGSSTADRRATLRVTGTIVDLVDVAVLSRALERGEVVKAGDIAIERRSREGVPSDAVTDGTPLLGRVARRAIGSGALVRAGDLARPEAVGRGEIVTAVYEAPGITLSMRVKASEAGAVGDIISVVNPASKKTLQASVVAPGKVSVRPGQSERVIASNPLPAQP